MVEAVLELEPVAVEALYSRVSGHIERARQSVQRSVDTEMVKAYWCIGRDIVEEEQKGKMRSAYGKAILEKLSKKLQQKYQRGFGIDTLEQTRKFYLIYQPSGSVKISDAMRRKSEIPVFNPHLSWTHYREFVNYFDQEVVTAGDNPTWGLILCTQKNETMVKYTLDEKTKKIFTSRYQFHLQTEAELEAELKRKLNKINSDVVI